jgi:hypothetical protein
MAERPTLSFIPLNALPAMNFSHFFQGFIAERWRLLQVEVDPLEKGLCRKDLKVTNEPISFVLF